MESVISLTLDDGEGTLDVPVEVFHAIEAFAERSASLVAATLDELGISMGEAQSRPMVLLVELAALAQLRIWEHSGVRQRLSDQLPPFREAEREFIETIKTRNCVRESGATPTAGRVVGSTWRRWRLHAKIFRRQSLSTSTWAASTNRSRTSRSNQGGSRAHHL